MGNRIGFVDYKLNNFHANTFLKLLRGPLQQRGFEVAACHDMFPEEGVLWAQDNSVLYCHNASEMATRCDYFMILAPSNPEAHLALAKKILPFGKPTYIDKTFAPDYKTAEQIFSLSDQCRTPIQSSSALRYASELNDFRETVDRGRVQSITTWGGGRSFAEYAIHPLEMAVAVMGTEVEEMARIGSEDYTTLILNYVGGRTAFVNVYADMPYQAVVTTIDKKTFFRPVKSPFFQYLLEDILCFFSNGIPSIDRRETLLIRKILDIAERSTRTEFIPLRKGVICKG